VTLAPQPLAVAQVTPYPWEARREVNEYVERVSAGLAARGHALLVLAPSGSRSLVRDSRRAIRAAASDPASLLQPGAVTVLAMGQSVPAPVRRGGTMSVPIDVTRTLERVLGLAPLDVLHVHEPFAPSAAAAALRHSRALNVATFHSPTERVLSTQVARRFIQLFFGRLDARMAASQATRELIGGFFPGHYDVAPPGADLDRYRPGRSPDVRSRPLEIAFVMDEERAALRLFLRALRGLPPGREWRATVWTPHAADQPPRLNRALRERVRFTGTAEERLEDLLGRADVVCAASNGLAPAPSLLVKAVAAGCVPIATRLPVYEEALRDGELGLLFEPLEVELLSAQLARLLVDDPLRESLRTAGARARPGLAWEHVADRCEAAYRRVEARRHPAQGDETVRARLARRSFIFCDLHMHTDHSPDCATPVDVLLDSAKRAGLGAIAVTDHNEIAGAWEAHERANGIKVIVAEEVKTDHEGEVIGLFIKDKIARGMSLRETIDEIHRQGGLAYVPHPFDRLHAVPGYEHLLDVIDDVDLIEVFNARVAVRGFNDEALRFAAKYRMVAGAGSDSHVPQGLGTVKIKMRDFDGPEEFLESLRDADILHKRKSLIYLQSLKFVQTKVRPRRAKTGNY
jgi:predicted metal-dependent phosphoesterase TrpH/glycosyltransferase involved in cell wall biosynthesis